MNPTNPEFISETMLQFRVEIDQKFKIMEGAEAEHLTISEFIQKAINCYINSQEPIISYLEAPST